MTVASVIIAICTYKRNEALATLLDGLVACAGRVGQTARIGVVIVDDTEAGEARVVADRYSDRFALGLHYFISGKQNISIARNLAIENAAKLGEWTVMTDDDCEPPVDWLHEMLTVQRLTGCHCVTGLMLRRPPAEAPGWIIEQPFLELGALEASNCQELNTAFTNNSCLRSAWIVDHPEHRFDPALGVVGGEDMAFFRAAVGSGLTVRFAEKGFVFENEPLSRTTFSYQLRRFYWQGNSSYITHRAEGTTSLRLLAHAIASFGRSVSRPLLRLAHGQSPHMRFAAASVMQSFGIFVGLFGVRVKHH